MPSIEEEQNKKCPCSYSFWAMLYAIFHLLLAMYALYLSFKCNKGFDIWGFLGAFIFPYIYIAYKTATLGINCSKLDIK